MSDKDKVLEFLQTVKMATSALEDLSWSHTNENGDFVLDKTDRDWFIHNLERLQPGSDIFQIAEREVSG